MSRVFNTKFEVSLRMVVLLDVAGRPLDLESIRIADFMGTYGQVFGLAKGNVNGDNRLKSAEFPKRGGHCAEALKLLVIEGYVSPLASKDGIEYELTEEGKLLVSSFESDYAASYAGAAERALEHIENTTIDACLHEIHEKTRQSVKRG